MNEHCARVSAYFVMSFATAVQKKTLNNNKCLRGNQQREVHEPTTKLFRELMLSEFEEKIVIRVWKSNAKLFPNVWVKGKT